MYLLTLSTSVLLVKICNAKKLIKRVARVLFLSLGPNLGDFLIESPLLLWHTIVTFSIVLPCQCSSVNYDVKMLCKFSFLVLSFFITWLTDLEVYEICFHVLFSYSLPWAGLLIIFGCHFMNLPLLPLFLQVAFLARCSLWAWIWHFRKQCSETLLEE